MELQEDEEIENEDEEYDLPYGEEEDLEAEGNYEIHATRYIHKKMIPSTKKTNSFNGMLLNIIGFAYKNRFENVFLTESHSLQMMMKKISAEKKKKVTTMMRKF